jgi:GAF domain-containing protein
MQDDEDAAEQPTAPPAADAPQAAVRPALVAATTLFPVDGAVLVVAGERGELAWAGAAGDLAEALERAAGPLWSGPCRDALGGGAPACSSDLPDDPRWPGLARALGPAGVNGLLCVPVAERGGPTGALTVVRRSDRPWQDPEVESVVTYGGVLAALLRVAAESASRAEVVAQLEHALRHRVTIEQAKGILMEREGLDQAAAFDRLRTAARTARRRVEQVAAEVVGGRPLPAPDDGGP